MRALVEEIKMPPVLLFVALYLFAAVLAMRETNTIFIAMSIGMLLLIWLVIGITQNVQPCSRFEPKNPGLEFLLGLSILLIWSFDPLRYLYLSGMEGLAFTMRPGDLLELDGWGFVFEKLFLLAILPIVLLKLLHNSFASMGLTAKNWRRNFLIAITVFAALAISSAFYSGSAGLIMGGRFNSTHMLLGFVLGFVYFVFMAGFPEELLFRALIQTRLGAILGSRIGAVLLASLLFGMLHIDDIMRAHSVTLLQAFYRAFFIQTFLGMIFGVLWERTRSLLPGIFVHSADNALNNLGSILDNLY
jgi:membrane protease YdiL (CAAX protease family)